MTDKTKQSKLKLALLCTALTTGLAGTAANVGAESNVSEKDMLAQAVALYEKLSAAEVDVPNALVKNCRDESLAKAVMLGYVNADDTASVSGSTAIRKQDAMTVLYKTVIGYDYSFALSTEEIDEIMDSCCDNALVDEENRAGFAFMLKHGIIDSGFNTEPNKLITWDNCATLVDVIYDLFVQDVTFTVGECEIKPGANIGTVTNVMGEPQRIDKSDSDFDWYVYNSDYSNFMMVGVKADRICAFYSNSGNFAMGDLKSGDDYLLAYKYLENNDFCIYKSPDGRIDAILYNPYAKSDVTLENDTYLRSCELIDMINAERAKSKLAPLTVNADAHSDANSMVTQPKYHELAADNRFVHTADGAEHETGYDIFTVYNALLSSDSDVFGENTKSVGAATFADENFVIYASVVSSQVVTETTTESADIAVISPETEVVSLTDTDTVDETVTVSAETADVPTETVAELTIPQLISPAAETEIADGDDVILTFATKSSEYYIEVYSIEDDEQIAAMYTKPEVDANGNDRLTLSSEMFTLGKDYTISVSAAANGETTDKTDVTVRYGNVPDDALTFTSLSDSYTTDNDTIELDWSTDLYSDFVVDAYDADGKLVLSETVQDTNGVTINNADPGTYYIYVTALRRGTTDVFKAQASVEVTVTLPEPVITEYILEPGEKFYPIYEDSEMGLLCFYDEEIVDVPVTDKNGKTVTEKRKKITEKQVKNVAYYKALSTQHPKVEYFEGSSTLTLPENVGEYTYSGSKLSIYDETIGDAAVREAQKYLGVPYVWGGTTPAGFDCSGLVQYVYKNLGINLNRVSQDQYKQGTPLTREELMPGDLVFFEKNGDVHHVGLYVGNGMMIHAPYTGATVCYQSIDSGHYKTEFCGGRRVY